MIKIIIRDLNKQLIIEKSYNKEQISPLEEATDKVLGDLRTKFIENRDNKNQIKLKIKLNYIDKNKNLEEVGSYFRDIVCGLSEDFIDKQTQNIYPSDQCKQEYEVLKDILLYDDEICYFSEVASFFHNILMTFKDEIGEPAIENLKWTNFISTEISVWAGINKDYMPAPILIILADKKSDITTEKYQKYIKCDENYYDITFSNNSNFLYLYKMKAYQSFYLSKKDIISYITDKNAADIMTRYDNMVTSNTSNILLLNSGIIKSVKNFLMKTIYLIDSNASKFFENTGKKLFPIVKELNENADNFHVITKDFMNLPNYQRGKSLSSCKNI